MTGKCGFLARSEVKEDPILCEKLSVHLTKSST